MPPRSWTGRWRGGCGGVREAERAGGLRGQSLHAPSPPPGVLANPCRGGRDVYRGAPPVFAVANAVTRSWDRWQALVVRRGAGLGGAEEDVEEGQRRGQNTAPPHRCLPWRTLSRAPDRRGAGLGGAAGDVGKAADTDNAALHRCLPWQTLSRAAGMLGDGQARPFCRRAELGWEVQRSDVGGCGRQHGRPGPEVLPRVRALAPVSTPSPSLLNAVGALEALPELMVEGLKHWRGAAQ